MRKFSGRGNTLDDARRRAAIAAISEMGPDAMIAYEFDSVKGIFGGIAPIDEVEVIIEADIPSKEMCADINEIKAYQHNQKVVIVANGLHLSSGYKTFFEEKPITVFPPEFILYHVKPSGPVPTVVTPFQVSASFESEKPVKEVVVQDASGSHRVRVEPITS